MTLIKVQDRIGDEKYDLYSHIYCMRLRNSESGIPTRRLLLNIIGEDAEALRIFEKLWPKEQGDM